MKNVMNVLGVALIVFGIVAVVFMVMNYSQNEDPSLVPTNEVNIEAPQMEAPDVSMPEPAGAQ